MLLNILGGARGIFTLATTTASETAHIVVPGWHWALLIAWFAFLIIADIAIFHRKDHEPTLKSAAWQSLVWIALGVALGFVMWGLYGATAGSQYFSGYIIEKSLSIDNVFAWSVIMGYFAVPKKYQHRVLFWGVFGALTMRAVFIFAGIAAIEKFEPILILFGGFLLYSGYKLLVTKEEDEFDPGTSKLFRWVQKIIPMSHHLDGHKLFTIENGKRVATGLFLALLVIEITDVIFAVDSVPAILAISRDPIIVFASNAAAILGMRALYFVFEKIKDKFWLLNKALGLLMLIIGIKMVLSPTHIFSIEWVGLHVSTNINLLIILVLIGGAVGLSLVIPPPAKRRHS